MNQYTPKQYDTDADSAGVVRKTRSVINPSTEEVMGTFACATKTDLDEVVARARTAYTTWKKSDMAERRALLVAIGDVIEKNSDELGKMLAMEMGRPIAGAKAEVAGTGAWFKLIAEQNIPVTVIEDNELRRVERRHVPLGVVAAIAPWNFPIKTGFGKVAPAILTGNCVILKPSPFTPLTTLRIAELTKGIAPEGVFAIIAGDDEFGPWFTSHPGINKITFTGSTETGKKVMANAALDLKRVTLELGGNDPAIVLPDADIEKIVPTVFWAAFRNTGQLCFATKRLFVHADIYDKFLDAFVTFAKNVKIGDSLDEATEMGPIQNKMQFEKVKALIERCREAGLKFAMGEEDTLTNKAGYFVPITILDNPDDDSEIVQVEPFGPVLPILKYTDVDEAIRRANATDYGLAAMVYSNDEKKAEEVASQLEAGMLWVNHAQYISKDTPFGGHKQSGMGSEYGLDGLLEYTAGQTVTLGKLQAS